MKNEVPSSENSKVKATKIPAPLPFRVFKSLLLFVPIVIVMIAIWLVFTGGFPTYFNPFDASSYPSGPIPELGSNMEYFGFGPDSLQPAIERIGPLKAINLEINNGDKVWSGLILSWGQNAAIPHNGTFDLQWRSSREGYRVLIDLTVGGGAGDRINPVGTNYYVYMDSPPKEWTTTSIPFDRFKLNPVQRPGATVNEPFDPSRITEVNFTFWPGTQSTIQIESVRFSWGTVDLPPILIIIGIVGFGIVLWLRTTEERILSHGRLDLRSTPLFARFAWIPFSVAIFLTAIFSNTSFLSLRSSFVYILYILSIIVDEFFSRSLSGKSIFAFRYGIILAVGWYLNFTFAPAQLILLLGIAFLPIVIEKSKLPLIGLPTTALVVLVSHPVFGWVNTIVPGGMVIIGLTFITMFARGTFAYGEAVMDANYALSLFNDALESTSDAIAVIDLDGEIEKVNKGFAALTGYEVDETVGKKICDFVYPDDCKLLPLDFLPGTRNKSMVYDARFVTKSGEVHSMLVREVGLKRNGVPTGFQIAATDITERKRAEESLRELNSFNEMLIKALPFGISIIDGEGTLLFVSERFRHNVGDTVIGQKCWSVLKDDRSQCADCPLRNAVAVGKSRSSEVKDVLGGKTFQVTHTGLIYKGKAAVLELFEDVTERNGLLAQLVQAQKMESLGTLASGISHDFNNILGIILGHASLMQRKLTASDPLLKSLATILNAAERGASLVKQLLTFARKSEANFTGLSINDSVKEFEKLFAETFPKTMTLVCNAGNDMPPISGDATQIHQALLNLSVNARDAMSGSGTLTITTTIASGESLRHQFPNSSFPEYVVLQVSDTGSGMDEETKRHVFEPFFTTKDQGKGTGLGLAMVFGIMEKHEGFIDVQSQVGKGTTMSLFFPVRKSPKEETRRTTSERESTGGRETILVVEDEEMLRELALEVLTSKGYNVVTAADGEEAVNLFKGNGHDVSLIVSDLGLPKLGGKKALQAIRRVNSSVKFIVVSGYLDPKERSELFECRVSEIIPKPYTPTQLERAVRHVLDN